MNKISRKQQEGWIWQFVAYLFALMIASYVYDALHTYESLMFKLLMSNLAATVVIFHFSYAFKNLNFYSIYWGLQPIVIGLLLLPEEEAGVNVMRQSIVILLVLVWGFRLIWNFLRRWESLEDENWRYENVREVSGKWFPLVAFLGLMLLPTVLVFLACLPLIDILSKPNLAFNLFDGIAIICCLGGIVLSFFADNQLRNFIKKRVDFSETLNTGLWKYSRHPNYFGEILFWVGIAIFGASAHGDIEWYHLLGTAGIILFIYFAVIPMQEKHFLDNKPAYANEIQKRSKLMLWKPKS